MSKDNKTIDNQMLMKKIEKDLIRRKVELEEQLIDLSTEQVSDGQVQDIGDQALSSIMESLRSSLQNTEVEEYKRIVKALEMIKEGTYGICTDCGMQISAKRLELFPNAVRCLVCQEALEEER